MTKSNNLLRCVIYAIPFSWDGVSVPCVSSCSVFRLGSWVWVWCWFKDVDELLRCLVDCVSSGLSPVALGSLDPAVLVLPFGDVDGGVISRFCSSDVVLSGCVKGFVNAKDIFGFERLLEFYKEMSVSSLDLRITKRGRKFITLCFNSSVPASVLYDLGIRVVEPYLIPPDPPSLRRIRL